MGKKSLQEPSSASSSRNVIGELLYAKDQQYPREPEAGANHTSGKYDVTIRSAAVKSRAHLEPVFSNGGQKYRDFRAQKLYAKVSEYLNDHHAFKTL